LLLQCSYYDHCGMCQGTGQECCHCPSQGLCYTSMCDKFSGACLYSPKQCPLPIDMCHTPTCDINTGNCTQNLIVCNDNSVCTTDSCDPMVGCKFQQINCNDFNPCTIDGCNATTGCTHMLIANCTPCGANITCPANTVCFGFQCNPITKHCDNITTVCNDNNDCTLDTCSLGAGGCVFTPISCDDNNNCTIDSCNPTSGCVHTPRNCDDGNACTSDSCSNNQCQHSTIVIPVSNRCNGSYCDPILGPQVIVTQCPTGCTGCSADVGCVNCPGSFGTVVAVAASIGAGIIAAIVIAIVVAVVLGIIGGKKGYDVWMKYNQNLDAAQENPLYNDNGLSGVNPLAED